MSVLFFPYLFCHSHRLAGCVVGEDEVSTVCSRFQSEIGACFLLEEGEGQTFLLSQCIQFFDVRFLKDGGEFIISCCSVDLEHLHIGQCLVLSMTLLGRGGNFVSGA